MAKLMGKKLAKVRSIGICLIVLALIFALAGCFQGLGHMSGKVTVDRMTITYPSSLHLAGDVQVGDIVVEGRSLTSYSADLVDEDGMVVAMVDEYVGVGFDEARSYYARWYDPDAFKPSSEALEGATVESPEDAEVNGKPAMICRMSKEIPGGNRVWITEVIELDPNAIGVIAVGYDEVEGSDRAEAAWAVLENVTFA